MLGLTSGLPERRGDTLRYGPLVLAAARVAGVSPAHAIHVDRVLAALTDDDATRLPSMTWGDLVAVVPHAIRVVDRDPHNWRIRAAARGLSFPGHAPTCRWAAVIEAVADDTLDTLANRLEDGSEIPQ